MSIEVEQLISPKRTDMIVKWEETRAYTTSDDLWYPAPDFIAETWIEYQCRACGPDPLLAEVQKDGLVQPDSIRTYAQVVFCEPNLVPEGKEPSETAQERGCVQYFTYKTYAAKVKPENFEKLKAAVAKGFWTLREKHEGAAVELL